ncbi:Hypothetical predicted protein, partial [Mytilus galloprovincialis]
KSTKLKNSRFKRLVLYLSVSDTVFLFEAILTSILIDLDDNSSEFNVVCMLVMKLTGGTYMFALYQCFLICMERLNATFITKKIYIQKLTSNRGVVSGFVAFHLISVMQFVIEVSTITNNISQCNQSTDIVSLTLASGLIAIMCIGIVIVYAIILARTLKKNQRQAELSNSNVARKKHKVLLTLTVVISVSLLANMPRALMVFDLLIVGFNKTNMFWLRVCNMMVMLNPLLDPVIYIFCLEDFRKQIRKMICRNKNSVQPLNVNSIQI